MGEIIMKKKYIYPDIRIIELGVQNLLSGSISNEGDNLRITLDSDGGGFGTENTINSRRGDAWDE